MLENILYVGRIFVPEFKGEDTHVVTSTYCAGRSIQQSSDLLRPSQPQRKLYDKENDDTPLRTLTHLQRCI